MRRPRKPPLAVAATPPGPAAPGPGPAGALLDVQDLNVRVLNAATGELMRSCGAIVLG